MKSTRLATLCAALSLASFFNFSAQAQITVDGTKDAGYGAPLAVQSVTYGWGGNQVLASLSAVQQGSSFYVFIAGRAQGNALMLFIDSKPGGITFVPNNLISGGGEEFCVNNFGASASTGMTFESGFQPDYAVRVYGDGGGGTGGWAAVYPLTAGAARVYIGDSGSAGGASGSIVTLLRSSWQNVTGNYADANRGSEIQLNLSQLGVPVGAAQPVKFMVMLVNGGSDYGSNQVLGSLPGGSGDMAGNMKTTDFNTVAGSQTISTTVDNLDADGDGISDATDPDDDNDGLDDTVETNTGTFVSASDTGSNPLIADTDGDGMNDGAEVTAGRDPNNYNYAQITVAGAFQGWSPAPFPTNAPANVMNNVSGTQWELNFRFTNAGTFPGKFTIGSWSKNWGTGSSNGVASLDGPNINFNATASGIWKFEFNTATLAYSFSRQGTNGLTYAQWAAQYGLAADSEGGGGDMTAGGDDFLTNLVEYQNNTDPLNGDTDGDGLFDDEEVDGAYEIYTTFNGVVLNPTSPDTDGDGLRDGWELQYNLVPTDDGSGASYSNYTGLTIAATGANPNGGSSDPDGDGVTNLQEQQAGTNPLAAGTGFASVHPKITVPGSFNGWNAVGGPANTMQLVGNFTWNLVVYFSAVPVSPNFKFAAGGWTTNWGDIAPADGIADAGTDTNISGANTFTAAGYYLLTFNDSNLAYTLGALPATDADTDGLPDAWEAYYGGYLDPKTTDLNPATAYVTGGLTAAQAYAAGSNPVADTVAPTIALATGVDKVTWVALGDTVNLANSDVTATDAITPSPTVSFLPATVDTSTNGITTVTYTATDAASNAATVTRVIAVGAAAPGYHNLRYPATMTINTATNNYAYGEIYIDGATAGAGAATGITAWVAVNTNNTDPATWTNTIWSSANYVGEEGSNDNYQGLVSGTGRAPGTYYYATRFQLGTNSTNFHYGGIGTDGVGGTWGATREVVVGGVTNTVTNGNGVLTVLGARTLTFAVNMNVQTNKSLFTPTNQGVEVRGSFNSWAGGAATLTDGDNDGIYTGSFTVAGDLGTTVEYKFYRTGASGADYEGLANNRTLTLGADGVNDTVTTSYFNNDDGIGPVITLTGASTINLTVGDTYTELGATTLDAIDGSGTATPSGSVNTAVAGTYTVTYNASDAAGNTATQVARIVVVAAAPSGSTFMGWAGGVTPDAAGVGKYAIGGASSMSATDGVKPTSAVSSGNLVLTAIVRTDDPKLAVVGEVVTSLANYASGTSVTEVTGSASGIDQTGVPAGCEKQAFIVPQGADTKKFLRLKATLQP
jgi:hypothetical protein